MLYTTERPVKVYNNVTGECYEISPDKDGLNLIEIRYYDDTGKMTHSLTMPLNVWHILRQESVF